MTTTWYHHSKPKKLYILITELGELQLNPEAAQELTTQCSLGLRLSPLCLRMGDEIELI
jgi:hypothetical protein